MPALDLFHPTADSPYDLDLGNLVSHLIPRHDPAYMTTIWAGRHVFPFLGCSVLLPAFYNTRLRSSDAPFASRMLSICMHDYLTTIRLTLMLDDLMMRHSVDVERETERKVGV
jgi:hypothetical protein